MSTLRNKLLVKNLVVDVKNEKIPSVATTSSTHGATSTNSLPSIDSTKLGAKNVKMVSVQDYQKISKAFLTLHNCNKKMSECLKNVSQHYKQRYEMQLQRLQTLLAKRTRKLQNLRQKLSVRKRYMIVVRTNNEFSFHSHVSSIDSDTFAIIVYKISKNPDVDKSVCASVAHTKYGARILFEKDSAVVRFDDTLAADNFEKDLKSMFDCCNH